jgi:hypothetical protein
MDSSTICEPTAPKRLPRKLACQQAIKGSIPWAALSGWAQSGRERVVGQDSKQGGKAEIEAMPAMRIVAEDDDHVVVAVHVEKAWLARNIGFLAALAELATAATITVLA